jgi:hypothetical protein
MDDYCFLRRIWIEIVLAPVPLRVQPRLLFPCRWTFFSSGGVISQVRGTTLNARAAAAAALGC